MKVTKVRYYLLERKNNTYPLARCSVIMDDVLKLDGIRLYDGAKGKYIAYPEKPKANPEDARDPKLRHKNEFYHPVERDFSSYLESVIIKGYQKLVEQGSFIYIPEEDLISGVELDSGEEGTEVL